MVKEHVFISSRCRECPPAFIGWKGKINRLHSSTVENFWWNEWTIVTGSNINGSVVTWYVFICVMRNSCNVTQSCLNCKWELKATIKWIGYCYYYYRFYDRLAESYAWVKRASHSRNRLLNRATSASSSGTLRPNLKGLSWEMCTALTWRTGVFHRHFTENNHKSESGCVVFCGRRERNKNAPSV